MIAVHYKYNTKQDNQVTLICADQPIISNKRETFPTTHLSKSVKNVKFYLKTFEAHHI